MTEDIKTMSNFRRAEDVDLLDNSMAAIEYCLNHAQNTRNLKEKNTYIALARDKIGKLKNPLEHFNALGTSLEAMTKLAF